VLSQQHSGAAVVPRWSAYIHPRLARRYAVLVAINDIWEVWRAYKARVFRKNSKLEAKSECRSVAPGLISDDSIGGNRQQVSGTTLDGWRQNATSC